MPDLAAPNPGNYTFGAHSLVIDSVDLGNLVSANVNVSLEELSHFSALSGQDVEDASVIRRMSFSITATLDEPNKANVFRFFMADTTGKVGKGAQTAVDAVFNGIAVVGNQFSWAIPKCYVRPDGDFGYNKDDWTTFNLIIRVVADPDSPTAPFGTITHTGTV